MKGLRRITSWFLGKVIWLYTLDYSYLTEKLGMSTMNPLIAFLE